jgi:hypothetical protein
MPLIGGSAETNGNADRKYLSGNLSNPTGLASEVRTAFYNTLDIVFPELFRINTTLSSQPILLNT